MSEMCCTRLAENTGRKKSPFWHHRTTLLGCIDNWKQEGQHPLTGQRAANFRRDLEAT